MNLKTGSEERYFNYFRTLYESLEISHPSSSENLFNKTNLNNDASIKSLELNEYVNNFMISKLSEK